MEGWSKKQLLISVPSAEAQTSARTAKVQAASKNTTAKRAMATGRSIQVKGTRANGKPKFCEPHKNGQAYGVLSVPLG